MNEIKVRGAREHNLKNVNLDIPKNKLVVFTGLSGSGKSSLAFDTIYAEGQRRYVESLSAYARQFLGMLEKPDVDQIDGLSPAISIDQKTVSQNPRSTVGTITEIYDYLRLLFARVGHPHCPNCGREIQAQTINQMIDAIIQKHSPQSKQGKGGRILILAPLIKDRKGEYSALFEDLIKRGYTRARIDNHIFNLDEDDITLIKTNRHTIEVIVDRTVISPETERSRLSDSLEKALKLSNGSVIISEVLDESFNFPEKPTKLVDHLYSENFACPECNISLPEIEPRNFSFNNPHGACPVCDGIGAKLEVAPERVFNENLTINEGGIFPWSRQVEFDSYPRRFLDRLSKQYGFTFDEKIKDIPEKAREDILANGIFPYLERRYEETESDSVRSDIEKYMSYKECPECKGNRLKPEALSVTVADENIAEVSRKSMIELTGWFENITKSQTLLSNRDKQIAQPIMKELVARVKFLNDVGLNYLTIHRSSATLSGGESQRIRLASQIGSGLSGVLYVLDEPSIGLHPRDHHRLLETLHNLRDLGNTVLIVEHDLDTMISSDWLVDFGPGAGVHGGAIIAEGTPQQVMEQPKSVTGDYMSRRKNVHPFVHHRTNDPEKQFHVIGATAHNLKDVSVQIPLGNFVCVTGVSGSGKSTLIIDTLYKRLAADINHAQEIPGEHRGIKGLEHVDKVIQIDQTPIGRTPRSNAATYTGVFTPIRELFATMPDAKARGYELGRFSFNVKGGRCENCQGEGQNRIEMQFLPDIYVTCETCGGARYNRETLDIKYKDKNISEVLDMTVEDACAFFNNIPSIRQKLETLLKVGLGYIKLGQPAPTLSGGEAQRVKLSSELSRRASGKTMYILDEPTTGLHFADIDKLLEVLHTLVDQGNTVIVIEHNLDVIKTADWIIDLGPEGGDRGGRILATGTVKDIINHPTSYTGKYLKEYISPS
ncbi:excinuclease ABC subunit UvrA [candidate division WWE3 bacterium]|nr:excinuclease ABC subunit UvrA [candidate division WWE3 bacterium]